MSGRLRRKKKARRGKERKGRNEEKVEEES